MVPLVLVAGGAAVIVGTLVVARRRSGRPERSPSLPHDPQDPWSLLAPRDPEEVEAERTRLWPAAGVLAGALLVLGGIVSAQNARRDVLLPRGEEATPPPFVIDLGPSPPESQEPAPAPAATAPPPTATPAPSITPSPPRRPSPAPTRTPAPRRTPAPTRSPTPPPRPGPEVTGVSRSCFSGRLSFGYAVSARPSTTLATLTVFLDGSVIQNPEVRGRQQFSSSFQRSVSPGPHTVTIRATGSDGGATQRSFPVDC